MALKNENNNFDEILQDIINDALFLKEYNKPGTLSRPDFDKKLSNDIANQFIKNLKIILRDINGINCFIELLSNENAYLRFLAARYLYPIMKEKSMKIMELYKDSLKDKFEIFEVNTIIEGLKLKRAVFMDQYKKLYNTDDLDSLNREKDI